MTHDERTKMHQEYASQVVEDLVKEAVHLREANYMSQADVASLLGLKGHGGLSDIETLKIRPRLDSFLKILSVYGYTLEIVPKREKSP